MFATLLPAIGMLAWWLSITAVASIGVRVTLPVTGYDPRDLLSGHFLQYRVDYGEIAPCGAGIAEANRCVCLGSRPEDVSARGINHAPRVHAIWSGQCSERPSYCSLFLSGSCNRERFTAGIERYYVPEEYAQLLAVAPPESAIEVNINSNGEAVVVNYSVDEVSLLEYALQRQRTAQQSTIPTDIENANPTPADSSEVPLAEGQRTSPAD